MKSVLARVASKHSSVLFTVFLSLLIAKVGFNKIPYFETIIVRLTQSPDGEYIGRGSYLISSWLGPALLHAVGIKTEGPLFVVYSAISIACVFLAASWLRDSSQPLQTDLLRLSGLAFLPGIFLWVGYDSLLVLLLLLGYRLRGSLSATLILGFLTGLQHAEIGVAASLLALVYLSIDIFRQRWRLGDIWPLWFLLGIVIGRAFLGAVFIWLNSPVRSRGSIAIDVLVENLRQWRLECNWASPVNCLPDTALPLVFSVLWPLAPVVIAVGRRQKKDAFKLLMAVTVAICLAIPVLDQTRVALLSLTFVSLMALDTELPKVQQSRRANKLWEWLLVVAWLLVPIPWVWDGAIHWYGFFDGMRFGGIANL